MEDDLKGRGSQGKNTSIEESRPQCKPYRKQMTLACLASQFCTELGPAQPQLVIFIIVILGFGKMCHALITDAMLRCFVAELNKKICKNYIYSHSIQTIDTSALESSGTLILYSCRKDGGVVS